MLLELFLEVAIEIAGLVLLFMLLSEILILLLKDRVNIKENTRKLIDPIIGAILGLIPGCGGSVVAVTYYKQGKISFGGVIASLVTTTGEGAFIILSEDLNMFLKLSIILILVGIIIGYIINIFIKDNDIEFNNENDYVEKSNQFSSFLNNIGVIIFYVLGIFIIPLSVLGIFGYEIENTFVSLIAVIFILYSIMYYILSNFGEGNHICSNENSFKNTLSHVVYDISFAITFTFIGVLISTLLLENLTFENLITENLIFILLLIVIISSIPGGIGYLIILPMFFVNELELYMLVAGSIAMTGHALFALMASNKKRALQAYLILIILAITITIPFVFI